MTLPRNTVPLFAKWHLNSATAAHAAQWATDALEDGFDSPAVRELAGLDLDPLASVFEAEHVLLQALRELSIPFPEKATALRAYAVFLAGEISAGRLDPVAGVRKVHQCVVSPLNHPEDVMPWCYLDDALHPTRLTPLDGEELNRAILDWCAECRATADGGPNES